MGYRLCSRTSFCIKLLAHRGAPSLGRIRVPSCCHRETGRKLCARAARTLAQPVASKALRPIVEVKVRDTFARYAFCDADVDVVPPASAMQQRDLAVVFSA